MPPDDPREWLRLARADLAIAKATIPGAVNELLCFHAQQAAEKALKALLVDRGIAFPFVHDLDRLLDLLEDHGIPISPDVRDGASELTPYAAQTRYPMLRESVTADELGAAIGTADRVLAWAEGLIRG